MSRTNWPTEKLWRRAITNKSADSRWESIWELRSRPDRTVFEEAVAHAISGEKRRQEAGINVLAQLGEDERPYGVETLAVLLTLLDTQPADSDVLVALIHAIGHNASALKDDQVPQLLAYSGHAEALIRGALATALRNLSHRAAVPVLIQFSGDESDGELRLRATVALAEKTRGNSQAVRESLWARTTDSRQDARYAAIEGLIQRKDPRISAILYGELLREELTVRGLDLVNQIADPAFLPLLNRKWKAENEDKAISDSFLRALSNSIFQLEKKDADARTIRLLRLIEQRDCVVVWRMYGDEEDRLSGFLIRFSDDFLLMALVADFHFDGYAILRQIDCDVQSGKYEWAMQRILEAEGALPEFFQDGNHPELSSWFSVMRDLQRNHGSIIVQDERSENTRFIIGPIEDVDINELGIRYFDPSGQLENELTRFAYDDITVVKYDTSYVTTFSKYLLPPRG